MSAYMNIILNSKNQKKCHKTTIKVKNVVRTVVKTLTNNTEIDSIGTILSS